jgi:hypothetical protein
MCNDQKKETHEAEHSLIKNQNGQSKSREAEKRMDNVKGRKERKIRK